MTDNKEDHLDRNSFLVEMTELRRPFDARLRDTERSRLWLLPPEAETTILDTLEDFWWLKDAGLTDRSAVEHLEAFASRNASEASVSGGTLRGHIVRMLKRADPSYLTLGDEILSQQMTLADQWAQEQVRREKSEPAFPPIEWLTERIAAAGIGQMSMGRLTSEWNRMLARLTEKDELWNFSSPAHYWQNLAGSGGVALIRDGRSIAHIITEMN